MNLITDKIEIIRKLQKLSQDNISVEMGISQSEYSKFINSKRPDMEKVKKAGKVLGMTDAEILRFDEKSALNNNHGSKEVLHNSAEVEFLKQEIKEKDKQIVGYIWQVNHLLKENSILKKGKRKK